MLWASGFISIADTVMKCRPQLLHLKSATSCVDSGMGGNCGNSHSDLCLLDYPVSETTYRKLVDTYFEQLYVQWFGQGSFVSVTPIALERLVCKLY